MLRYQAPRTQKCAAIVPDALRISGLLLELYSQGFGFCMLHRRMYRVYVGFPEIGGLFLFQCWGFLWYGSYCLGRCKGCPCSCKAHVGPASPGATIFLEHLGTGAAANAFCRSANRLVWEVGGIMGDMLVCSA